MTDTQQAAPQPQAQTIARLRELTGSQVGRVHTLGPGRHVLGRGSECSIVLTEPGVSRRHAELEVTPDDFVITDLGSKNGIHCGDRRLFGQTSVVHGTQFRIGQLVLEVLHPGAGVRQALREAGEFTSTRVTVTELDRRHSDRPGLKWPITATLVFLAVTLWLAFGR